MRKHKIAVVVPKYGLTGGAEHFAYEVTELVANNPAYDIHVFANQWKQGNPLITFHKVPIITFPKWLTTLSFAFFANHMMAKYNFDLIHTHDRIFEADICTLHSVPHRYWVKTVRKKTIPSLFDLATIFTEKKMVNNPRCRLFLPVSKFANEIVLSEFPQLKGKTKILSPGVDLKRFEGSQREKQRAIRAEFGFSQHDFVVLFVGMNFELKGLDQLLVAASLARKTIQKPLKVLVVGKGNIKKYSALTKKLGLEKDTVFAGTRSDIENVYPCGDLLVILSELDTFGMVVLEAMANSLPVIVSHNVGAKDIVQEETNGFVVDRYDTDSVCLKIVQLVSENFTHMATEAKKTAQKHSWNQKAQTILSTYNKIIFTKIANKQPKTQTHF